MREASKIKLKKKEKIKRLVSKMTYAQLFAAFLTLA